MITPTGSTFLAEGLEYLVAGVTFGVTPTFGSCLKAATPASGGVTISIRSSTIRPQFHIRTEAGRSLLPVRHRTLWALGSSVA